MNTQTSPTCITLEVVGNWLFVTGDLVTIVLLKEKGWLVRTLNNRSEDTLSPSWNNDIYTRVHFYERFSRKQCRFFRGGSEHMSGNSGACIGPYVEMVLEVEVLVVLVRCL